MKCLAQGLAYSNFLLNGNFFILFEFFVCNVSLGHFTIEFGTQYKTILFLIIFFIFFFFVGHILLGE